MPTPFIPSSADIEQSYQATMDYLYENLPVFQRIGTAAYKKDLTNTLILAEHLGHPELQYPTIHVGGTNGKGSVTHLLAAALQAQGKKVGVYTSPHYKDFRERIKINGEFVTKLFVTDFVARTKATTLQIQPSFFELSSMMAFDYFRQEKVDIAVIEVGLGGRLDSTNVVKPIMSVITNISFDHTDLLGDTLEEIAFEKAGIIKPQTPVVIGEFNAKTNPIFIKKAIESDANIFFAEENFSAQVVSSSISHTIFEIYKNGILTQNSLSINVNGDYQKKNVATVLQAIAVYNTLDGIKVITENDIKNGFRDLKKMTTFMGRWQILSSQPTIIADSAHNEGGLRLTMRQLASIPYRELHFVLGMVNDKDLTNILPLLPTTAKYYFAKANIPRGLSAEILQQKAAQFGLMGESYESVVAALLAAQNNAHKNDVIYVGGSCFVVAEVI